MTTAIGNTGELPTANLTMTQAKQLLAQIDAETAPERSHSVQALTAGSHDVYTAIDSANALLTRIDLGTGTVRHHGAALDQARAAQGQLKQLALLEDLPFAAVNHVRDAHAALATASAEIAALPITTGKARLIADTTSVRAAIGTALESIPFGGPGASDVRRHLFTASRELDSLEVGEGGTKSLRSAFDAIESAIASVDPAAMPNTQPALRGVQDAATMLRPERTLQADTVGARQALAAARHSFDNALTQAQHGGVLAQVDTMLGALLKDIGHGARETATEATATATRIGPSAPKVVMPDTTPILERAIQGIAATESTAAKIAKQLI